MEWASVISGVLAIIGLLVKMWVDKTPERKKEEANETTQRGRLDLVTGNAPAVTQRMDNILRDCPDSGAKGLGSEADTQGRLEKLTGMGGMGDKP